MSALLGRIASSRSPAIRCAARGYPTTIVPQESLSLSGSVSCCEIPPPRRMNHALEVPRRRFSSTLNPENDENMSDLDNGDDDDDDDDAPSMQPWRGLLETPARAAWRVTDPEPPAALLQSAVKVLEDGDRTPRQLLRAHRRVLSVHSELAEMRERERRRIVNGKRVRASDSTQTDPVFYGYEETLATLRHRLMPHHAITKRVLEEARSLLGREEWTPKRIVDFGIGCGSASAAALSVFGDIEWIHGIDPSQPMRDCSKKLIEGLANSGSDSAQPRLTFSTTLSTDSVSTGGNFDLAFFSYTATELPDVMSTMAAAAILFEKLKPNGVLVMIEPGTPDGFNAIRSVRNMLLDCCPPDDPDFEWPERCHIIAPCTHNGTCPMERHKKNFIPKGKLGRDLPQVLAGDKTDDDNDVEFVDENALDSGSDSEDEVDPDYVDITSQNPNLISQTEAFNASFCSFVQSLPNSDMNRKGEKFSYLVAQKRVYGAAVENKASVANENLAHLLARAHGAAAQEDSKEAMAVFEQAQDLEHRYQLSGSDDIGLDLLCGDDRRDSMGRIVRAPIKKKGHIYVDYCAAPGRIIRSRVTKARSSNIAPGMYTAARKSRWGGFWPDLSTEETEKTEEL